MDKILDGLDLAKIAAALVPAAMIAIWRSYLLNGRFPRLGKDDVGQLLLVAGAYFLFLQIFGVRINEDNFITQHKPKFLFLMLLLLPAFVGLGLGYLESSDYIGKLLRKAGVKVPYRHLTAWQTIFQELDVWAVIIIHRPDDDPVAGRWAPGSSASLDEDHIDLYLSEYGSLSEEGQYSPMSPRRGVYVRVDEIKALEIVQPEMEASIVAEGVLAKARRIYRKAIGA